MGSVVKSETVSFSIPASAAIAKHRFVSPTGGIPTLNGNTLGVSVYAVNAGEGIPIDHAGMTIVEAGTVLPNIGAFLATDNQGRAIPWTTGAVRVAILAPLLNNTATGEGDRVFVIALANAAPPEPVTPPVGTMSITSPIAYQTYQRDANDRANIPISGSYSISSGTMTGVEARWNNGNWMPVSFNSGNNTFSGTLPSQLVGQGSLEVRFVGDSVARASRAFVSIGDVFWVQGQSNAEGRFTNNQTYTHPTLKAAISKRNETWKELADPAGSDAGSRGSIYPLLATRMMAHTGVPIAFIVSAIGGRGLVNPPELTKGGTVYNNAIAQIQATGVNALRAMLWLQGEQDAIQLVPRSTYLAALLQMAADVRSDLGFDFKVIVSQIGRMTVGSTDQGISDIRMAHLDAWNGSYSNILAGAVTYDLDTTGDNIHFTSDPVAILLADRVWRMMRFHFYGSQLGRGMRFGSASYNGNIVEVRLTNIQLPLVNVTNTIGWRVTDSIGTAPISSASLKVGSIDTIRVKTARPLGTDVKVSFGYGNQVNGLTLRDSASLGAMPPDPFVDAPASLDSSIAQDPITAADLLLDARHYYRLDNGSFPTDAKGVASLVAAGNAIVSVAGLASGSGSAAQFDGISARLETSGNTTHNFTGDTTLILCYRSQATVSGNAFLIGKYDTGANQRAWTLISVTDLVGGTERIRFSLHPTGAAAGALQTDSIDIPFGNTVFVVAQYSPSNFARIGMNNGAFVQNALTFNVNQASTSKFAIGTGYSNGVVQAPFKGIIDAVGFWNRILTTDEISFLFNSGAYRQL